MSNILGGTPFQVTCIYKHIVADEPVARPVA